MSLFRCTTCYDRETLMKYVGDWSDYWHDYRWYPLPGGNHRAVGDALSALALMQRMAAHAIGTLETEQEAENEDTCG